jgi:hypothetical protein
MLPVPDNQAWAVDALSVDLQGFEVQAFPPYQLIGKLLKTFQLVQQYKMILIAPSWPHQSWFQTVTRLAAEQPWELPLMRMLLKQPRSLIFIQTQER